LQSNRILSFLQAKLILTLVANRVFPKTVPNLVSSQQMVLKRFDKKWLGKLFVLSVVNTSENACVLRCRKLTQTRARTRTAPARTVDVD